jgi:hypothetical protein
MFSRVVVLVSGLVFGLATVAANPAFAGGYGKKGCDGCNMRPTKVIPIYSDVWHKKKIINHRVPVPKTKVINHNKLILYKHIKRHHHPKVHVWTYVHQLTVIHKHNTYKKHVNKDIDLPPEITRTRRDVHAKTIHKNEYHTYDCGCGKGRHASSKY